MARYPILNLILATVVMWLMLTVCLHTSQATPDGYSAPPSDLDTIAAVTSSAPAKSLMVPLERYAITTESLWDRNRSGSWIVATGVVMVGLLAAIFQFFAPRMYVNINDAYSLLP